MPKEINDELQEQFNELEKQHTFQKGYLQCYDDFIYLPLKEKVCQKELKK